jgi:hypothetical protein
MIAIPIRPTLAGFLIFIRTTMGISTSVLPDSSPVIPMAFAVALGIVNPALWRASIPQYDPAGVSLNSGGWSIYALAVYNLAGDNLVNYAPDVPDAPIVKGSNPPASYFENLRQKWNLTGFVSGVISGSSDEGTSQTLVVQEAAKNFTLSNLQNLKTPWGRAYLAFAQDYGPVWGLS